MRQRVDETLGPVSFDRAPSRVRTARGVAGARIPQVVSAVNVPRCSVSDASRRFSPRALHTDANARRPRRVINGLRVRLCHVRTCSPTSKQLQYRRFRTRQRGRRRRKLFVIRTGRSSRPIRRQRDRNDFKTYDPPSQSFPREIVHFRIFRIFPSAVKKHLF